MIIFVGGILAFSATSDTVDVMVKVSTLFEVKVDRQLVDFHAMKPGATKENAPDGEGVKVVVKSNSGSPWYLSIHNEQELSDGVNYIPNTNFFWYGYKGAGATGIWHGVGTDFFTTDPVLSYTAGSSE